jgi:soluble lytic murein transglycosylase-like protein
MSLAIIPALNGGALAEPAPGSLADRGAVARVEADAGTEVQPTRNFLARLLGGPGRLPDGSVAPVAAEEAAVEEAIESGETEAEASAVEETVPYEALIHAEAEAQGVPVELAEAVVHVESNFNARARGRAGEVGLMQIKPATARGIGYSGSTEALYDPATNIRWGMLYLAEAYRLAGGDTCGTILRYNAGHAARRMNGHVRRYCARVGQYVAAL